MTERRGIPLSITVDDQNVESESTAVWAGAYVLTIATTIPASSMTVELHSTYVGHPWDGDHPRLRTQATHLELGPHGCPPCISHATHSPHDIDPLYQPRGCAYDHVHCLLELSLNWDSTAPSTYRTALSVGSKPSAPSLAG